MAVGGRVGGVSVGGLKAAEAMALAVRSMGNMVMEATGAVEAVTAKEEAAVTEETVLAGRRAASATCELGTCRYRVLLGCLLCFASVPDSSVPGKRNRRAPSGRRNPQ